MNLEERENEKMLKIEAEEKKREKDRDREKDFLLQGSRYETKEVVPTEEGRGRGRSKKLRVTYCTNMDGLLSSMLEVRDYLKEKKPDVMCIVETNLREKIHVNFKEEGYKIGGETGRIKGEGGGVLIMVRDNNICVEDVQYGENNVEVMGVTIKTEELKKLKIIVTYYVPPKSNTWGTEEHKDMQREVIKCLDNMIRREGRILLVGDFNCNKVNWREMEMRDSGAKRCYSGLWLIQWISG